MIYSVFLLVILGVVWASGYAIAGYCMTNGVSPYGYAFWQSCGPLLCLLAIQIFRGDLKISRQGLLYSFCCAVSAIVVPNLLIYFAAKYLTSGILTVLANLAPIFTYPLAMIFGQERFNVQRFTFVIVGFVGVLLIVVPSSHELFVSINSIWLYLALLIPFGYAMGAVIVARFRPEKGNILNYSMWMLLISTFLLSPITFLQSKFYPLLISDFKSWLIILEVLLSTFGYVLLFFLIGRVGPVYYTLVNAVAAVSGVFYGVIIFNQKFSIYVYFAIFLIVMAIIGLTYSNRFLVREGH